MKTLQISDATGSWFTNTSQFQFHDPESGTTFLPGMPTQAAATPWLETMAAVIIPIEDPTVAAVLPEAEQGELEPASLTGLVNLDPPAPSTMAEAEAHIEVKDITVDATKTLTLPTLGKGTKNR